LIFTGSYVQDFKYTSTITTNLEAEIVLKDANLNLCSLACVNADGFNCNSFDYCPLTMTCLLNSGNQQVTKNPNGTVSSDSCAHYKSNFFSLFYLPQSRSSKKMIGCPTSLVCGPLIA
jgi:hypothetical protein